MEGKDADFKEMGTPIEPPETGAAGNRASDSDWSDINTDDDEEGLCIGLGPPQEDPPPLAAVHKETAVQVPIPFGTPKSAKKKRINTDGTPRKKTLLGKRSRNRKRCSSVEVPTEVLDAIAGAKGDTFNLRLDKAAKKMRLNRTQVRGVLRRLVESPELINLVLEKADGGGGPSSNKVEPRITRKLAQTVVDSGGKLNWFLEKVAKTPKKVTPESLALMQEEFPEDEDDQEYDPAKDPGVSSTVVGSDDEDSVATASETGAPGATTASDPFVNRTPPSAQSLSSTTSGALLTPCLAPAEFKHPAVASDPILNATSSSSVARALNFEAWTPRNTRSKSSLKEVTIEELEVQFQPPDVTPDMYDPLPVTPDDYAVFLAETFGQPLPLDQPVEEDPDPDFVYQDVEEKEIDEFKNNRSTKIPQKEVDALMQELFDAYDLNRIEDDQKTREIEAKGTNKSTGGEFLESSGNLTLTEDQKAMVRQQMRQHIQLLTQMSLLTSNDPYWAEVNGHCGQMLSDLVGRSFQCQFSHFAQDNLFPSLGLIDEFKRGGKSPCLAKMDRGYKFTKWEISQDLMNFMKEKTAFIYPNLLPVSGIAQEAADKITYWSLGEDQLLCSLFEENDRLPNPKNLAKVFKQARERYLVTKTETQIRARFKNQTKFIRRQKKDENFKMPDLNSSPILFYKHHKTLLKFPGFSDLLSYDPSKIAPPSRAPPSLLPQVWRDFLLKFRPEDPIEKVGNYLPVSNNEIVQTITLPVIATTAEIPSNAEILSMPTFSPIKVVVAPKPSPVKLAPKPLPPEKISPSPLSAETPRFRPILKKPSPNPVPEPEKPPKKLRKVIKKKEEPNTDITKGIVPIVATPVVSGKEDKNILDAAIEECGIDAEDFDVKSPAKERKTKLQRDAEVAIATLKPEGLSEEVIRREHEALEIVMYAREELSEKNFRKFYNVVSRFEDDPAKAFVELHPLCEGIPCLQDMLLDILTAEQALSISPVIYRSFCERDRLKKFVRKMKKSCPTGTHSKVLKDMQTTMNKPKISREEWKSLAVKYFKGNQILYDEFISFLPGQQPYPDSLMPGSPERIDLTADDVNVNRDYERLEVGLSENDKRYGGDDCPCLCHPPHTRHCAHCSIKFVNGRVYIRYGKTLKPAKIEYPEGVENPFEIPKKSAGSKQKKKR